jgi:phosphinothricin acetyltransferase
MEIRPATPLDSAALATIYNHYVATTCITFETDPVTGSDMAQRIEEVQGADLPWLVALRDGVILGYAYASKWKGRCAYRYSVESTVYLDPARTGQGIGRPLYAALIDHLRGRGLHAVIGGIALPNMGSIALHERLGFRKVAHFEEAGFKQQRWIDVGYWQLLL